MTHQWQSESVDGFKGGWVFLPFSLSLFLSLSLCVSFAIYLLTYLSSYLPIYLSTCLSIYLFVNLFIHLLNCLSIYLYIDRSIYISIYVSTCLSICLSTCYLSSCKVENKASLRDFFTFWNWQHQKRSNSARLSHFLKLATSKPKQFCETLSFFEVNNIKNEAILRDCIFFWNG